MTETTAFLELARLFDALEATMSRKEKKIMISSFLQSLGEDEVQVAVTFLIGRAFPEAS